MLGKGFMAPEMVMGAQSKLEGAIEELREKYARKAEIEAAEAAEKAKADRAKAQADAQHQAQIEANKVDMTMEDPELEALRQQRLAALKALTKGKQQQVADGHGELREIVEEEFLKEVTSTPYVIVHFYHDEFMTCKVMDKHLRILAPRILTAKFLRINANKAPFFVSKLKIRVLPSLAMFKDGILVGHQTGFEGLVNSATDEDFPTYRLQRIFRLTGMMGEAAMKQKDEDSEEEEENRENNSSSNSNTMDFQTRLANARRAMLESLDDDI